MFNIVSEDNSNPREHAIGVAPTALIFGLLLLAVVCAPEGLATISPFFDDALCPLDRTDDGWFGLLQIQRRQALNRLSLVAL